MWEDVEKIRRVFVSLVKLYQMVTINANPCCRFIPCCSQYAIEAIEKYGVMRGSILSMKRILRCRPRFFRENCVIYDPVP